MVRKGVWIAVIIGIVAACGFGIKARAADATSRGRRSRPQLQPALAGRRAVSLSQYKGKWVVLYFYPKDMTTGCTIEAHNFQRDLANTTRSTPSCSASRSTPSRATRPSAPRTRLTFKLLADPDHKVIDAYGVPLRHGPRRHEVRQPRHLPHLARRQDRQGLDQSRPQHPLRRRPRRHRRHERRR